GLSEKNISWIKKIYYFVVRSNFTYFLSPSVSAIEEICNNFGCKANQVTVQAQPRLQPLIQNLHNENSKATKQGLSILYAPTWRHKADTRLFPFEDFDLKKLSEFLTKTDATIYLRLHPYFENHSSIQTF